MGNRITKRLVLPMQRIRRQIKPSWRPVYTAYRQGLEFRRDSIEWSLERKEEWILKTLRGVVRSAAETTKYYKELYAEIGFDPKQDFTFEDFAKLPVLDRETVNGQGNDLLSNELPESQRVMESTGGSTGSPTRIWQGPEERGWLESGIQYAFERIGVYSGDRMAFLWGHHLDPSSSNSLGDKVRSFLRNERYFDCFRLSNEVYKEYHERLEQYGPDCVVAYASALGRFSEYLAEAGIQPKNYPKKCFVTGAEKLSETHREAIEFVFGNDCPVHERYGGRDFGAVGIQVDPRRSLVFEVDWALTLVERGTDEPVAPILVTKLHADAMPMIRYRVGDIARFPADSVTGRPAFSIEEVTGRALDGIWLKGGRWVHGSELPHLLKDFPVREYSFVQEKNYEVYLRLVARDDLTEEHISKIRQVLTWNLEELKVNVQIVDSIGRTRANKLRPVITKVER